MARSQDWICVRFLGAFGKRGSLADSIKFELHRSKQQVCATILDLGEDSGPYQNTNPSYCDIRARIGLLVDKKSIRRWYDRDVWSSPKFYNKGYLSFGRCGNDGHNEAWVLPCYKAIVTLEHPSRFSKEIRKTLAESGLKILYLHNHSLEEVII